MFARKKKKIKIVNKIKSLTALLRKDEPVNKNDTVKESDEEERYREILVFLPKPVAPHSRISLPGE